MENEVIFSWVRQELTGYIYCVTFGNQYENPIKIGYAVNVDTRLADLQIGNPYSLYTLAVVPGNTACEKFVHDMLFEHKARNEWFWPTIAVKKCIKRIQSIEKAVRDGHWHLVRKVVVEQSRERLIDIVPGINEKDLRKVTSEKYNA